MRESDSRAKDWAVVGRAEAQEGLVRHEQLLALGLDKDAIARRLDTGRLHRKHQLVYSVGHRLLRPRGEWLAAFWAAGEAGVLSHLSAAALYGWIDPDLRTQHVTTPGRATSRPGLVVHRVRALDERDVKRGPLLSATRPARTIIDLAGILPLDELRRIVDRVRDIDPAAIRAAQGRVPGKRGARNVRRLLGRLEAHTKSEFERRYLRFCRRHGVPLPSGVNVPFAGFTVDALYAAERVVVELDGRAFHQRRDQMAADRNRDRKVIRAGHLPVRLVWEDVDDEAARATVTDLRDILSLNAAA